MPVWLDFLLNDGRGASLVRLASGLVLTAEGLFVATDRWGSRRLLVERLLRRLGRRGRLWRFAFGPSLFAVAVAFLALGAIELVRAAQSAV